MPAAVQVVIDYVIKWSARFKGGFFVRYDLFSNMQSLHDYFSQPCLSLIKKTVSQYGCIVNRVNMAL